MGSSNIQRMSFLALSALALMIAVCYTPVIYGNDEASIKRYLYENMGEKLQDSVEILSIQDCGADRIAIFRKETKEPDDVWVVRFQKDAAGNYADYHRYIRQMQDQGAGIYIDHLPGLGGRDESRYSVIWNTNSAPVELRLRFGEEPEQAMRLGEVPSLTVLQWPEGESSLSYFFYNAHGGEI